MLFIHIISEVINVKKVKFAAMSNLIIISYGLLIRVSYGC
jgi:hypothetical protein